MLVEEAESFSKTDDDIGRAEELQVDINPPDSVPVHKNTLPFLVHFTQKSDSILRIF